MELAIHQIETSSSAEEWTITFLASFTYVV